MHDVLSCGWETEQEKIRWWIEKVHVRDLVEEITLFSF